MYGGFDSSNAHLEAWQFGTSAVWSPLVVTPKPPKRASPQMVWDSDRESALVFGGLDGALQPVVSSHRLDGLTWTDEAQGHAVYDDNAEAAYDASHHRALELGNSSPFNEVDILYAYANGTWSTVCNPCGAGPRTGGALVFDRGTGSTLLIGGYRGSSGMTLTGTWRLDATDHWELIDPSNVPHRSHVGIAYDEERDVIVIYGGQDESRTCEGDLNSVPKICKETWEYAPDRS